MHIFKCFERQELDLIVFNLIKNYFPDYFMMILYFIEIIQAGPKLFDSILCKKKPLLLQNTFHYFFKIIAYNCIIH